MSLDPVPTSLNSRLVLTQTQPFQLHLPSPTAHLHLRRPTATSTCGEEARPTILDPLHLPATSGNKISHRENRDLSVESLDPAVENLDLSTLTPDLSFFPLKIRLSLSLSKIYIFLFYSWILSFFSLCTWIQRSDFLFVIHPFLFLLCSMIRIFFSTYNSMNGFET